MGDVPTITAAYLRLGKPPIPRIGDHTDENGTDHGCN
jgi:hypothetical protein